MSRYNYDRLSAQDTTFLVFENPNVHMHVSATQIFQAGPLRTEDGGIDIDAYKAAIQSVLHRIPRYRQRLKDVPFLNQPVWIDDRQFNIEYHVRHTSLPRPGTEKQLKHMSARIMGQPLDRDRPLWELWVIEGLQGDRFAVISKIHHCMIDGASGVDLSHILMSTEPVQEISEAPSYLPRPEPSGATLLRDEIAVRAVAPLRIVRGLSEFVSQAEDLRTEVGIRVRALGELLGMSIRPSSDTPLNGELGPHRRFDWLTMPLEDFKEVRRKLGCSLNDVVLAVVSGAVRTFLQNRQVDPSSIDFRVSAPVSVRREQDVGKMGNHVSSWIVRLPLGEEDPLKRVEAIHTKTKELKESRQALGVEMIMGAAEFIGTTLLSLGSRAVSGPINSIVTNVPGPQFPLYMLGAKMEAIFPQVPLLPEVGLGIALMSYDGSLCWGFNADYELIPDLWRFAREIENSFAELQEVCGLRVVAEAEKPTRPKRKTKTDPMEPPDEDRAEG